MARARFMNEENHADRADEIFCRLALGRQPDKGQAQIKFVGRGHRVTPAREIAREQLCNLMIPTGWAVKYFNSGL
jgi:hypothetical protein